MCVLLFSTDFTGTWSKMRPNRNNLIRMEDEIK